MGSDAIRERLDDQFRTYMRLRQRGEIDQAESMLRALVRDYGAHGYPDRQAMAGINLAQLLHQTGRLSEAEHAYREALVAAEAADDLRRIGLCLSGLATVAIEDGRRDRGEDLLEQAITIFRELDDAVELGNQLGNLGLLRRAQGRIGEALGAFVEAAKLFARVNHHGGAAGVLQCLGELHRRQGENDEAEAAYAQALALASRAASPVLEAHSCRALGQLARARGDVTRALNYIEEGMRLHERARDLRGQLETLVDLASVHFARGDAKRALAMLDECVRGSRERSFNGPLLKALLNRALYRLDTDRFEQVDADLGEARTLLDTVDDPAAWNAWSVTRARLLIRVARWDEARAILEAELARSGEAGLGGVRAPILGLLASVDAATGEVAQAKARFAEAESLFRLTGDVEGSRMALLAQARLLAEAGAAEACRASLERLREALDEDPDAPPLLRAELASVSASAYTLDSAFTAASVDAREAEAGFRAAGFELSAVGAGLVGAKAALRAHREQRAALPEDLGPTLEGLASDAARLDCPTLALLVDLARADLWLADPKSCPASRDPRAAAEELASGARRAAARLMFPEGIAQGLEVLARARGDRHTAARAVAVFRSLDSVARAARVVVEWDLDESEIERAEHEH